MIDGGSSDTKSIENNTIKISPGLSFYEDQPENAGVSLYPLLEFAKSNIPTKYWTSTPILLYATAGLRTLPAGIAEDILENVRIILAKSIFLFENHWAKIISGRDEGTFSWLTANYLSDTLKYGLGHKTIGILEMGGASIQVSFVPHLLNEVNVDLLSTVKLGTANFLLYTHSYLNYGINKAQQLLIEKNYNAKTKNNTHPCYPKGYEFENLAGDGDYNMCKRMVSSIVDKSNSLNNKGNKCSLIENTCSIGGVYQPAIKDEKFLAVDNFFYTPEFFEAEKSTNFMESLVKHAKKFCASDWKKLESDFPKEPIESLGRYCFSAAYIEILLKDGFGIKEPSKNLKITKRVNNVPLDWGLGSIIYILSNKLVNIPCNDNNV